MARATPPSLEHLHFSEYEDVYEPAEDSFLLLDAILARADALAAARPALCVEIGSGTGIASVYAQQAVEARGWRGMYSLATDINQLACAVTLRTAAANMVASRLDAVATESLGALRARLKGAVDLLLFNPPYVPTPDEEVGSRGIEAAWAGGARGRVVIDRVLPLIQPLLCPGGLCLMVLVEDNAPEEVASALRAAGLEVELRIVAVRAKNEALSILAARKPSGERRAA